MPGPLTYAAITLLARDRLGQIRRALQAKKDTGLAKELDLHVLHLASLAESMMNASQPVIEPPVRLYGPPLTDHVSRFALLGAVGPDLPRYAAYFVPGQRWLFDTLHKGTPDEHRELVLVNSTNLVFDFWKRVRTALDAEISDPTKRVQAKQKMQAYSLGHLCHVAADVLCHPYFESVEARLSIPAVGATPRLRFMQRDDVAGAFDVRIADKFFGRGTDTRNKKWADWFPTPGEVPKSFATAMAASIQNVYGLRAVGLPAFEEAFGKLDPAPPPLSADLIEESIDYFRTIIEIERVWTFADWLGVMSAMFLPNIFAYFGALALPEGKNLSQELPEDSDRAKQRTYEQVVFPFAFTSLGPLVTMIIVSATGRQLRAEGVTGWVHAGLSIVATIGFFASLGGAGAARWTLWFAIPVAFAVFQMIFAAVRGNKENARKLLWFGPAAQLGMFLLFLLLYHVWLHDGVEELQKDSDDRNDLSAFGDFAAWAAICIGLWFLFTVLFRWVFSSSVEDDQNDFASGEPRHFLRLYDDVALVHDFGKPADSEKLIDLAYPPARRPIVKFWWVPVGNQAAQVVIAHDRITFSFPGSAVANRVVFAPLAPITIEKWAALLAKAVTSDAAIGTLHTKPAREDEKAIELSVGAVFADNGDDKTDKAGHDAAAIVPANIGATEAAAFTLFHTPRPRLSERMGQEGVVGDEARTAQNSKAGCLLQFVSGRQYHSTNATDGTSPVLGKMFLPGDIIEIAPGTATPEQRIVERVINDTDLVVSSVFTTAIPGGGIQFRRAPIDRTVRARGGSVVTSSLLATGIGPNDIVFDDPTIFAGSTLMVGDVVEIGTSTFQRRRVVAIKDATATSLVPPTQNIVELDAPLLPRAGGASANGSLLQLLAGNTYRATNDVFGFSPNLPGLFQVGDIIELTNVNPGERQTITQVAANGTDITVGVPFATAIPVAGIGYKRASFIDRLTVSDVQGFPMVADPSDVFGDSSAVMNDAADLAALLCIGAASRLQVADTPITPTGATKPIHRVSQVFRNWNLDRRRVNEWKMMVSGGAASERRGDYRTVEEAAPIDPSDAGENFTDAFIDRRKTSEAIVLERGWLGVFRSYVDMATRANTDSTDTEVFRPGEKSNRDLSRAMAYLLDSVDGVVP